MINKMQVPGHALGLSGVRFDTPGERMRTLLFIQLNKKYPECPVLQVFMACGTIFDQLTMVTHFK